jgi:hypothetical protein
MKWKKLGKIFDPTEHFAFREFVGFAQSPQVLELEDRIRVYFSIRKADSNKKFLSHVSFVEFDKYFKDICGFADNQIIELGRLGSFDEHGIFPFSPIRYKNVIYAYTCGWTRRVSVSVETSTGLSISNDDGLSFNKFGDGPIFSSSLNEPFLVGDSFVRIFDGIFHMWYICGTDWIKFEQGSPPDRVYKIRHAKSIDGINWERDGQNIVQDKLNKHECQALPSVLYWNGKYHMYFCYRHADNFRTSKEKGYRIGYAYSEDLINWIRDDSLAGIDVSKTGWDSEMICYPHIFECNGHVYLLYNGNQFGKYGFGLAKLEN